MEKKVTVIAVLLLAILALLFAPVARTANLDQQIFKVDFVALAEDDSDMEEDTDESVYEDSDEDYEYEEEEPEEDPEDEQEE